MKIEEDKVVYFVTEAEVQQRAEEGIQRELTKKELRDVVDKMFENNWHINEMIDESIVEVVELDKLVRRNRKADVQATKYLVYWKNDNAFQKDYVHIFTAKSETDAREYAKRQSNHTEYDYYKITCVRGSTETEVDVIHLELRNEAF